MKLSRIVLALVLLVSMFLAARVVFAEECGSNNQDWAFCNGFGEPPCGGYEGETQACDELCWGTPGPVGPCDCGICKPTSGDPVCKCYIWINW